MNVTDNELIQELSNRFAQSRKAFSDLSVVNRKLVEMNQRLEESEQLKSNFLSNIRNEINNPLNAIIGLSAQLAAAGGNGTDVKTLAALICSEASNLDFQLRNIFMAAELEAGEVDPHSAQVNVSSLVADVVESFRHTASRRKLSFLVTASGVAEPLIFATDAEKLQIIVSNVIANAVEYSPEGGQIDVCLTLAAGGELVVSVQDCGPGIAPEDQKRIFDRFVQLMSGTTRAHLGHGLGLSIARALADLLQGSIHVESVVGKGATFFITVPAASTGDAEGVFAESGNMFVFDTLDEK